MPEQSLAPTDGERAEEFQTELAAAGIRPHTEAFVHRLKFLLLQVRHDQTDKDAMLAATVGSGISAADLIRRSWQDGAR